MNTFIILLTVLGLFSCGRDESTGVALIDTGTQIATGQKGDRGDKGDKGDKGDPGKDGTTTVVTEVKEKIVNGNSWYDVIDKKYWLIPSTQTTMSIAAITAQCGSNYRLPNYFELLNAVSRGLRTASDAISGPREGFIQDDGSSAPGVAWTDLGSGIKIAEQYVRTGNTIDGTAGYYCIEK